MSRENIQGDPPRDDGAELSEHSQPIFPTVAEQLKLKMTLVAAFNDSLP